MAFRKKLYENLEQLQADADEWMRQDNEERTHSGKYCYGKTPLETLRSAKHLAEEKMLDLIAAVSLCASDGEQASQ